MDYGHYEADRALKELEKKLSIEYSQANKEVEEKALSFLKAYEKKDKIMLQKMKDGKITPPEYINWRKGQMATGERWEAMRATLAEDYLNVNKIASSMIKEHTYEVYALNHNYGTFEAETGSKINTSYTLYNREAVERLATQNKRMLPPPGKATAQKIREGKARLWENQQLQSVMIQGILQGESITGIAKRLSSVTGEKNMNAAVRNARTMTTKAENAGRSDAYKRAISHGIEMENMWVATLDSRTRPEHAAMDGVTVPVGEYFEMDGYSLEYPGDEDGGAPPELIYNCRCCLVGVVAGTKLSEEGIDNSTRPTKFDEEEFKEWEEAHKHGEPDKERPIIALGNTGYGYSDEQQTELLKLLDESPEDIQQFWADYSEDLEPVIEDVAEGKGHFSPNDEHVHFKRNASAKGCSYQAPNELHFHEYGHNLDYLASDGYGNYLSTTYRDAQGRTFGEIINDEWDKRITGMLDNKKFWGNADKTNGGMGAYEMLKSDLTSWRRKNKVSRDDSKYLGLMSQIESSKDNNAELFKIYQKNIDILRGKGYYKYEKAQAVNELITEVKGKYTLLDRANLSDMLETYSVSVGGPTFPLGVGHGKSYTERHQALDKEAFTEMFSSEITNKGSIECIKEYLPESYGTFKEILAGAIK